MTTTPRIPRHRAPVIPAFDRPAWYELTPMGAARAVLLGLTGFFVWACLQVAIAS